MYECMRVHLFAITIRGEQGRKENEIRELRELRYCACVHALCVLVHVHLCVCMHIYAIVIRGNSRGKKKMK
jgi:hypothetical protein